jgi:hypothetical protein
MNEDELRDYILNKIREYPTREADFAFSITLPCGCCGETRHFYADLEEWQKKDDDELIDLFETVSEVFLNHVTSWYESGDSFHLNFNADSV